MEKKLKINDTVTDIVGYQTLDGISQADKFNQWMFSTVSKGMDGEILEIGSGIGNISSFFVRDGYHFTASDLRKEYCEFLQNKFEGKGNFNGVHQIDIVDKDFDKKHAGLFQKFDVVFALNIIEHVSDDDFAIKNCLKLLKEGGKLVILVPAFMYLFNSFDEELGHFRRYNRKKLESLFSQNNLDIFKSRYFNFAGVLGWWFSGNVLMKKTIPSGQMKFYNSMVWIFKIIDFFTNPFIGLSVIVSGKK